MYTMKLTKIFLFLAISVVVCIGNTHPAAPIRAWCNSTTLCGEESVCISNKCFSVDALVAAYGPVKGNADGVWCDSSVPCGRDMICLKNECIDQNRNWSSGLNDNEVSLFDVRIKSTSIHTTPSQKNHTTKLSPENHSSREYERSEEWEWN